VFPAIRERPPYRDNYPEDSIRSLCAKLIVPIAKCLDTYIALSAMHNPPTPISRASQAPPQLTTSFDRNAVGGASTSASLASPITPFSQSALPSKSLLSREDSSTFDPNLPGGGNAGVAGAHPTPLVLQRSVQKNLQATIRRIFESCYENGDYKQVVGIAIEARNLEVLRECFLQASQEEKRQGKKPASSPSKSEELMEYVLDICMNVVQERGLRNEVIIHRSAKNLN
jgi:26S proteasome regulatory subunit N2